MFCFASGSQACGCSFHTRQPNNLYVVSTYSLCTGLLRQREFPTEGFLNSEKINLVVDAVNGIAIDSGMRVSYGGKTFHSNDELQKMQTRIAEPEHEMRELEKSYEYLNSFLPSSPPIETSSPSCRQNIVASTVSTPAAAAQATTLAAAATATAALATPVLSRKR